MATENDSEYGGGAKVMLGMRFDNRVSVGNIMTLGGGLIFILVAYGQASQLLGRWDEAMKRLADIPERVVALENRGLARDQRLDEISQTLRVIDGKIDSLQQRARAK